MPNPTMPRDEKDPTGLASSRRRADKRIETMFQSIARDIRKVVAELPREQVAGEDSKAYKSEMRKADLVANEMFKCNYVKEIIFGPDDVCDGKTIYFSDAEIIANAALVTNKQYSWQVDNWLMDRTMNTVRRILTDYLLSGDTAWQYRWWFNGFIDQGYEKGTLDSIYSAKQITRGIDVPSANAIAIMEAEAQLQTQPYLSRLQLVHGRVFEEMAGIVGDSVAQLRRVLTDGMARGLGIRDIGGMINDRVGVGMSRAKKIARTEINKAYTDAYMDEADELNKNLEDDDLVIRQMHVSALTSTTRRTHAMRHGTIHTRIEQQKWWDSGANRINCYCSVTDVLVVKSTGKPEAGDSLIKRTRERGEEYFKIHGFAKA